MQDNTTIKQTSSSIANNKLHVNDPIVGSRVFNEIRNCMGSNLYGSFSIFLYLVHTMPYIMIISAYTCMNLVRVFISAS